MISLMSPSVQFKGSLVMNDQHLNIPADAKIKGYYSCGEFEFYAEEFPKTIPAQENFQATYIPVVRDLLEKCAKALPDDYTLTYTAPPYKEKLELSVNLPLTNALYYPANKPKPNELDRFKASVVRDIPHRSGSYVFPWNQKSQPLELEKFKQWLPQALETLLGDVNKAFVKMKEATDARIGELGQAKQAVASTLTPKQ